MGFELLLDVIDFSIENPLWTFSAFANVSGIINFKIVVRSFDYLLCVLHIITFYLL